MSAVAATSFGQVTQIDAGVLSVGYADAGPADGLPSSFCTGGRTTFTATWTSRRLLRRRLPSDRPLPARVRDDALSVRGDALRNGQQAALAADTVALMDALAIDKAIVAGFDWGARTANVVAALWPERCQAMVSVSGYLIGSQEANKSPLPPRAELHWWYQYYFATDRGRAGYDKYRNEFAKLIWQTASPKWHFDDATFERIRRRPSTIPITSGVVIHNYRWRLGWLKASRSTTNFERRLAAGPVITVPTITLEGDANGAPHPEPSAYAAKFSRHYSHRTIEGGVGHNLPQEAPAAFADAVLDVGGVR